MRKWYVVVISIMAAVTILVMMGCDGEQGQQGRIGETGVMGPAGIDSTDLPPDDREIAVGLTNGTFNAVNGITSLWMTFDSTARGRPDTLAATRVEIPPVIDGIDDESSEWGPNQSRTRLTFLNPDPDAQDPNIYDLEIRAAYDDENIYMFFGWKEVTITIRTDDDRDTTLVDALKSTAVRELFYDNTRDIIEDIDTIQTEPELVTDTTFFPFTRIDTTDVDEFCFPNPTDPDRDTCFITGVTTDTSIVWRTWRQGEDRLVVFFDGSENPVANWAELAFAEFFEFPGNANLPSGYMVDTWAWGSGSSDPVYIADDWMITSSGKMPDAGKAPFLTNFVVPDSVPKFMHYLDPNYKSALNLEVNLFPFWFYDAVGYQTSGWFPSRPVFVAGIVTTIPNGSRADVYAASSFESARGWVLEMKRARRTYHGDDVEF